MSVTSVGNSLPVIPVVAPMPSTVVPPAAATKKITDFQPSAPAKSQNISLEPVPKAMYTKADITKKPSAQDLALSRMAERIITKQYSEGNQFYKLLYGHIALRLDPTLISSEPSREAMLERARDAVGAADAPFSPEATARQIVDFVESEAAGDAAKTERYRAAVQDAFAKLARMSGGQMPELTKKTYDAVMQGLTPAGTEVGESA